MANTAGADAGFTSAETLFVDFALRVETRTEDVAADGSKSRTSVTQSNHIRGERVISTRISPDIGPPISAPPERQR
jgi:hypothetical protein